MKGRSNKPAAIGLGLALIWNLLLLVGIILLTVAIAREIS